MLKAAKLRSMELPVLNKDTGIALSLAISLMLAAMQFGSIRAEGQSTKDEVDRMRARLIKLRDESVEEQKAQAEFRYQMKLDVNDMKNDMKVLKRHFKIQD